jgi:hypothetical protein
VCKSPKRDKADSPESWTCCLWVQNPSSWCAVVLCEVCDKTWDVSQVVELLFSMLEALGSIPSTMKQNKQTYLTKRFRSTLWDDWIVRQCWESC